MKKLFFFLFLLGILIGCNYHKPVNSKTEIPKGAYDLLKDSSFNSIPTYIIKEENYHYYFNENKELTEKYLVDTLYIRIQFGVFLTILIVSIFIFYIIGYIYGRES